jgi:co-chaperonin GroES (HSP10)
MASRKIIPPDFRFDDAPEPVLAELPVIEPINPALIPQPVGYRVVIRPKPAAEKIGTIAIASRTKNTDLAIRTIGQVLKKGQLAFTATLDGMDLSNDMTARGIKEGDWVIYRANSGQKIKIGRKAGAFPGDDEEDLYLLIMSDTDIFCAITQEQAFAFYDWVS